MRKSIIVLLLFGFILSGNAVSVMENTDGFLIENKYYKALFSKKQGLALSELTVNGRKYRVAGGMEHRQDGETEKYTGQYAAVHPIRSQIKSNADYTVTEKSDSKIVITVHSKSSGMSMDIRMTFDDSPMIKYHTESRFSSIMADLRYNLTIPELSKDTGSLIYPDNYRVRRPFHWTHFKDGPSWKYAWSPKDKAGIGIIVPARAGLKGIEYLMNNRSDGFGSNLTILRAVHRTLRFEKLPATVSFDFAVFAGVSPEEAISLAAGQLGSPEVEVVDNLPEKLVIRKNASNNIKITLLNNTSQKKKVRAVTSLEWGIDGNKVIDNREIEIPALQITTYDFRFTADKTMEWGVTCRTRIFDGEKEIANYPEYFAISDFAPRVTRFAWFNAGFCHQPGSEEVWAEFARRSYIGLVEFYLWVPSHIRGLAPKADSWRPHTEGNVYYNTVMHKDFIQGFVGKSQERGVSVLSTITGLYNFKEALKKPEEIVYCQNGQPSVYNGSIINGERVAMFKANAYSEEFAADWGKEMNASVDMFKWNGCRWDWYFISDAPNDPLYLNTSTPEWCNDKGVPSGKLYPDPDKTGAKALTAWRKTVSEKNPDFIYSTNIHANEKSYKRNPEYLKVAGKDALLLYEYMVSLNNPQYNTWQKWAGNLTADVQRMRPLGAQPTVGFLRGLPDGSVSLNTAQYLCHAAGAKWTGTVASSGEYAVRDRFMMRFSEFYFHNDFKLLPEKRRTDGFQLTPDNRIYFRQFIYERQTQNGRQVTVHLINLPAGDYICQRHEKPEIRNNLTLTVSDSPNEKITSAYALFPAPEPRIENLQLTGNQVSIPELTDAAIVVLNYMSHAK